MLKIPTEPIEGFFITTVDNLIFDVKGITHPRDKIIAFIRYIPLNLASNEFALNTKRAYQKLYELDDRFIFLKKHHPNYLFQDPMGRGLLQAIPRDSIATIHNPIKRLQQINHSDKSSLDSLEQKALNLSFQIKQHSSIDLACMGISGSLLVNLHNKQSDIDIVVYGKDSGLKVFNAMDELFESSLKINRYSKNELMQLWMNRGQDKQIDFQSFLTVEENKNLQGTISGKEFYIRLILHLDEYYEPYEKTQIFSLGELEIIAEIKDDQFSIFTPCIYYLTNVKQINPKTNYEHLPDRIFSLRGRYCELAKKGDIVLVKGKLEKVQIKGREVFYQLVLGTLKDEFFKKSNH